MGRLLGSRYALTDDPPREGGLARVHRAVDVQSNPPRNVAVKIVGSGDDEELIELFFSREVEALRSLRHPHIVELIDAGRDVETGEHYVVLEWIESDLLSLLATSGALPFDDFLSDIALPLSGALAAAHERQVIHRDVKPSNVLITSDGIPKLADFGISKIKSSLATTPHTTAHFSSRPYAPPEHESTSSYTRDVYGFGVLMARCLSDGPINDYPDIKTALDSADVAPELLALIERCVDFDPGQRPPNGSMLYAELDSLHRLRQSRSADRPTVYMSIGNKARAFVAEAFEVEESDVEALVRQDLGDAPAIRPLDAETAADLEGRQFFLFGTTLSYRVVIQDDGTRAPSLFVMSAVQPDQTELDRARDSWLVVSQLDFRFAAPLNHLVAREALAGIVRITDEFLSSQATAAIEREERRLLDEWRRQIAARDSIESNKELPARFSDTKIDGRRVRLRLADGEGGVSLGEVRRLETLDGARGGPVPRGEVESIEDGTVTLYMEADPEHIPARGRMLIDTSAAKVKIDREKSALSDLIHGGRNIVRPDLRELIVHPDRAVAPTINGVEGWLQPDLDPDKQEAVLAALGCDDIFLVQGPPGTGKTTFIAELIAQELRRNPRALILVASQTNVALDNALVRISELPIDARLIRLADAKATRVASGAEQFLLDRQIEAWRRQVSLKSQAFLEEWCEIHGVPHATVRTALDLQALAELRRARDQLRELIDAVREDLARSTLASNPAQLDEEVAELSDHREELRSQLRTVTQDEQDLWKRLSDRPDCKHVPEDASSADLVEVANGLLAGAGDRSDELRSFVSIQAEWTQRLGRGDEFVEPLLLGSQVLGATCVGLARYKALKSAEFDLCIIDEASKATATEALVPMVRSKRWVLVGDQRQLPPFQEDALREPQLQADFQLDPVELRRTLFERLAEGLPEANTIMLRSQRRMTEAIGTLISDCFYDGTLISNGPPPIGPISSVLPRPVTWLSTSRIPKRHEQADQFGTSFLNLEEAREVVSVLRRLARWYRPASDGERLHVLVLAPYQGQVSQLRHRVAGVKTDLPSLEIEVNTIDAVQGREAAVVIFSVTRSNAVGNMGFLGVEARANVALSRAQRALIVIGDDEFCRGRPGPLRDVLDHIDRNPDTCALTEVLP